MNMSRATQILELVEVDDLTGDLEFLSEELPIDVIKRLIEVAGGMTITIPQLSSLNKPIERWISDNLNRIDRIEMKRLAKDLSVNERTIIRTVKRVRATVADDKQLSLSFQ